MTETKIKSEPIKTVLVITLGFVIVFIFTQQKWAILVASGVGFCGLISNWLASKIDYVWMKLAWVLGKIMPNIILSAVFYFFLTPIALMSRLGRVSNLQLKNTEKSLFKNSLKEFEKKSFEHPW